MITKLKSQFPSLFLRPVFLEHLVVLFQERRCIKAVRALAATLLAVLTLLNHLHLLGPFLSEIDTIRCALQEKTHTGTVVDFNASRTRHAIAAATAELARQLGAFLLNLAP